MKNLFFGFVCLTALCTQLFSAAEISPYLQEKITGALEDNQPVRAIVVLQDQVDIQALDKQLYTENASPGERAYRVITTLQEMAELTQGSLLNYLNSRTAGEVVRYQNLWIVNMFLVEAVPAVLLEISQRSDIAYMDYDHVPQTDDAIYEGPAPIESPNNSEPGLRVINAHKVWQLGYSGAGRLVMNIDTGVDGNHPALSQRWRGTHVPASQAWFGAGSFPNDNNGHGTHTMGTMTGMDPSSNDTVGVAPAAEWIAAATIGTGFSTPAAFQWAMDPDGNPVTTDDMPDVISNSWGFNSSAGGCMASTYAALLNSVEAAGIAVVFSAGNSGPGAQTITGPKNINTNLVNTWATGNINGNTPSYPIASSSSRGPSGCGGLGSLLIKPEAVAPGSTVRSSLPGGGYGFLSGTSMACPHVSGAVALLKEAFPNKTGHEIKLALYYTATETPADLANNDPGEPAGETSGEDNNFGNGVIDVYGAYLYLLLGAPPLAPTDLTAYSDYTMPTSMELNWTDPTHLVNGDPLSPGEFFVIIERDGMVVDSVQGGAGQFLDIGLSDGQEYTYTIYAKITTSSAQSLPLQASWIAGGSPIPVPPADLNVFGNTGEITLKWNNPALNIDGTPMDDFAGIRLYQDSVEVATFNRTSSDTAGVDSASYMPATPGYYYWYITAIDNESPQNESAGSGSFRTPLNVPFEEHFSEAGEINPDFWTNEKAEINTAAVDPPSGPFSLNVNGTGIPVGNDLVESYPFDLTGLQGSGINFAYLYQPEGSGDPPQSSDSLKVYFKNDAGDWVLVRSYTGSSLMPFQQEIIDLNTAPNGGGSYFFNRFQLRLTVSGRTHPLQLRNDWFVDNIYFGVPAPKIAASQDSVYFDSTAVGQSDTVALEIQNVGLEDLEVLDIIAGGNTFSVDQTGFSVPFSTHENVNLIFSPAATGNYNGMIRVAHNVPNQDTLNIYVEGSSGPPVGITEDSELPGKFAVSQNYPNPFNPATTIKYQLPEASDVRLVVYNVLGQEVRTLVTGLQNPGYHQTVWDGRNQSGAPVSSGIYIYRFEAGDFSKVQKMILLK